jgi:hypothetical protein
MALVTLQRAMWPEWSKKGEYTISECLGRLSTISLNYGGHKEPCMELYRGMPKPFRNYEIGHIIMYAITWLTGKVSPLSVECAPGDSTPQLIALCGCIWFSCCGRVRHVSILFSISINLTTSVPRALGACSSLVDHEIQQLKGADLALTATCHCHRSRPFSTVPGHATASFVELKWTWPLRHRPRRSAI